MTTITIEKNKYERNRPTKTRSALNAWMELDMLKLYLDFSKKKKKKENREIWFLQFRNMYS
jgi:hypothetical protein